MTENSKRAEAIVSLFHLKSLETITSAPVILCAKHYSLTSTASMLPMYMVW